MFTLSCDNSDRCRTTKPARLRAITFASPMISRGVLLSDFSFAYTSLSHRAALDESSAWIRRLASGVGL
jgi:hypothetical protein